MSVISALLTGLGTAYVGVILWLIAGLWRGGRGPDQGQAAAVPSVSVIVPARNEEVALPGCLRALQQQDHSGPMEIVVVDDESDDGSAHLVQQAIRARGGGLKLVRARTPRPFRCRKKSALRDGIEASQGDLLLFTDADCEPPPGWVSSTVAAFGEGVGLVAGFALPRPGPGILHGMLALDNQAVAAMGAGSIGMGAPLSCTGRNLAYRREVYEEIGGFAAIGHLIGGDDVYFTRLVAAKTGWRIIYNRDPRSAVPSGPGPGSWSDLLHQKLRHASKAGHYHGPALAVAVGAYAFHLLLLLGLVGAASLGQSGAVVASVWAAKWAADALLVWYFTQKVQQPSALAYLPLLELSYIPYVLVFAVVGRLGWFRWKPPQAVGSTSSRH